jgi:outer membrane biosynthesis protein TonB
MDPRERAEAALARARARGAYVVTPEDAISPMDAASTIQIPRVVVAAMDQRNNDPEATMVVPHPLSQNRQQPPSPRPRPYPPQQQQRQQQPPPPPPPRQQQQQQQQQPHPQQPPEPEQVDGMVPTMKQPPKQRPTMSQRLDGQRGTLP